MEFTQAFVSGARECEDFLEAVDIIKGNSSGKAWLVGGFVYRTIASQLYGLSNPIVDFDFIIQDSINDFNLPPGWRVIINAYGNPKFVNGKKKIDYVPLSSVYSILRRQVEPTIENYLTGVPLTIQSIAYDVDEEKVIGEIGINAVQKRVVGVNNLPLAEYAAKRKNKSLRAMIQEKADGLGFTPIFPA